MCVRVRVRRCVRARVCGGGLCKNACVRGPLPVGYRFGRIARESDTRRRQLGAATFSCAQPRLVRSRKLRRRRHRSRSSSCCCSSKQAASRGAAATAFINGHGAGSGGATHLAEACVWVPEGSAECQTSSPRHLVVAGGHDAKHVHENNLRTRRTRCGRRRPRSRKWQRRTRRI